LLPEIDSLIIHFKSKIRIMKNQFILFFSVIAFFGITSCSAPAPEAAPAIDMASVKSEIQAMEDAYGKAYLAKDAEAVAAYYSDDAVSLVDGEPSRVGKAAIIEGLKADLAKDSSMANITFEIQDLWAEGNLAVEVGKSTATDTAGVVRTGKYVSIFQKRDVKYVCVRDIWNEDAREAKK
jgi:uncharacterized protein (TIGR02246 family)